MYDGAQLPDRVKADYDTMNAPNAFLSATIGSYTLTQDCDWTDFGEISFASFYRPAHGDGPFVLISTHGDGPFVLILAHRDGPFVHARGT